MLTWLEIGQLAVKWRGRMYHSYFVYRKKTGVWGVIGLFRNPMLLICVVCVLEQNLAWLAMF